MMLCGVSSRFSRSRLRLGSRLSRPSLRASSSHSSPPVPFPLHSRLGGLGESATVAIHQKAKALEKSGVQVCRLGFGQSPFPVPQPLVDRLRANATEKEYLATAGLPELREAIANHLNRLSLGNKGFTGDHVLIGPGSKELIFNLQLCLSPTTILPIPCWVSYQPQSQLSEGDHVHVITTEKDRYLLTAEGLESRLIRCGAVEKSKQEGSEPPTTYLLLLTYPNNPTGTTFTNSQLKSIAEVALRYNMIIVSDEIYGRLAFDDGSSPLDASYVSISRYAPDNTIVSSGLSKWAGSGGWRVGMFAFPQSGKLNYLRDAMVTVASETFTSVSAPIQHAAVAAYEESTEMDTYLRRSRDILKLCGNSVHAILNQGNISCPEPDGGFYLFPNFEHFRPQLASIGVKTSVQLCDLILAKCGITLLPGSCFGMPRSSLTARLSYVDFDGEAALKAVEQDDELTGKPEEFMGSHAQSMILAVDKLASFMKAIK